MYRLPIKLSDSTVYQVCRYTRQFARRSSTTSTNLSPEKAPFDQQQKRNQGPECEDKNTGKESKRSGTAIWLSAFGVAGLLGASIVYARSDPTIRDWLKKNQPWAEDVLSVFDMDKYLDNKWIKSVVDVPSKLISGEKSKESKDVPRQEPVRPAVISPSKSIITEEVVKEKEPSPKASITEITTYKILTNDEIQNVVLLALEAFEDASRSLKKHNEQLYEVMDSALDTLEAEALDKVKALANYKNAHYQKALKHAAEVATQIAALETELRSDQYGPEQTRVWKRKIEEWKSDIKHAEQCYEIIKETNNVTEKFWKQVEPAREKFAFELQSLFPNLDIHRKKLNIAEGSDLSTELDIMLLHVLKVITYLQKELAASTTIRSQKLDNALKDATDADLVKAKVAEEAERAKRDMTLDFQKKLLAYRIDLENEMRQQLKLQVQAHWEHLNDALLERERQVRSEVENQLHDKMEAEQKSHKIQLAAMVGKLKGVDDALKARSETDKLAKQSVALWSAGEAILAALRKSPSSPPCEITITPIQNEIKAIQTAAVNSDELVEAVLAGIPDEVKTFGVYSESALKERFSKVEKLCRRIALVPEGGAGLPTYILSWFQSWLLFKNINTIPQSELDDQPTDFSKLDTNAILQRARYCVERNDIRGAVRYMSLTSGAARNVASGWIRAARDHLATRQAAEVVMAHATAAGMLYL